MAGVKKKARDEERVREDGTAVRVDRMRDRNPLHGGLELEQEDLPLRFTVLPSENGIGETRIFTARGVYVSPDEINRRLVQLFGILQGDFISQLDDFVDVEAETPKDRSNRLQRLAVMRRREKEKSGG